VIEGFQLDSDFLAHILYFLSLLNFTRRQTLCNRSSR
jgi:hypothetical protein